MTNRCRWLIAISIFAMISGLLFNGMLMRRFGYAESGRHLALLGLIVLFFVAVEWFLFRFKTLDPSKLFHSLSRTVDGSKGESISIALEQNCQVKLNLVMNSRAAGLRMFVQDHLPVSIESDDRFPAVVDISHQRSLRWTYSIVPKVTGKVALPGLQITLTDKMGLFRLQRFIPLRQELTLMPFILQPKNTTQIVKSDNIQLLAGQHRFRKPGFSSELLGIREYRSGDPPRSIAWKATARTGKLMTCEYESEVPVRCTLIADVSSYQFWGRPGRAPFDNLASAVASITQLFLEDKDPVGAVFVNGPNKSRIRAGLGKRQLVRILQQLLASHPGDVSANEYDIDQLAEFMWKSVYRIYPELFHEVINRPRLPLLLFGPARRYRYYVRHQVSAVLNWIRGGSIVDGYELAYDDTKFREICGWFLNQNPSVSNSSALVADFGRSRIDKEQAISNIAASLIEGVARAQDNELFVLIGDFGVAPSIFEKLLNSVRVARANYHRVMILNVPLNDISKYIQDPTARQTYELLQRSNMDTEIRHFVDLQQLGTTIALLSDVNMLESVTAELKILKNAGSRGPVTTVRAGG